MCGLAAIGCGRTRGKAEQHGLALGYFSCTSIIVGTRRLPLLRESEEFSNRAIAQGGLPVGHDRFVEQYFHPKRYVYASCALSVIHKQRTPILSQCQGKLPPPAQPRSRIKVRFALALRARVLGSSYASDLGHYLAGHFQGSAERHATLLLVNPSLLACRCDGEKKKALIKSVAFLKFYTAVSSCTR